MENAVSAIGDPLVGLLFIDISLSFFFLICMCGRQADMDGAVFTFRTVPWKHENDERTCAMNDDAGECAEDHDRQISVSTASCQI